MSTPGDVEAERVHAVNLIREVNETVKFLAPSQDVQFEIVRYETHSYPDIGSGSAQEVIDAQLPVDYDLYLGVMWKRAGTPTLGSPSGTIHEFEQALAHKEDHGWPLIFFFFCDDRINFPHSLDDVEQLREVLLFRERINTLGLTVTYQSSDHFRDALRVPLLRALADIVERIDKQGSRATEAGVSVPSAAERDLRDLARAYDDLRREQPSGDARTREMTRIANAMVELAPLTSPLLDELEASASAGERLAAISILRAFPNPDHLEWLADRLDNPVREKPFVGYQAAVALGQAVTTLADTPHRAALEAAVDRALALARSLPTDPVRIRALEYSKDELQRRSHQAA